MEAKKKRAAASRAAKTTIVVGLDFGTTYSGVSWARSSKPDHINTISAWGGHHYYASSDKQKAPSVISYGEAGQVLTWGYGFAPPDEGIKWFKLLLIDDADLPDHLRRSDELTAAKATMARLRKGPIEVIGDYLRCLWTHSYSEIAKSMSRQFVESCQLKIVATLPAIWPAYAQVRMREALSIAGILDPREAGDTDLTFISEPEAAALASLQDILDRPDIKSGDHFVICDAGGGTVDLITYAVTKKKPVVLRESIPGDGDLCGAILLDQKFKDVFRTMIGRPAWENMDPQALHFKLSIDWENGIKRNFAGGKETFKLMVPSSNSEKTVHSHQLHDVFSPVASAIAQLVKKQVSAVDQEYVCLPKAIIMVGGLGKSPFLYQYLENHSELEGIPIYRDAGERPWTAVSRGAVIRGLSDSKVAKGLKIEVSSRMSRYNYGTLLNTFPFETGKDDPRDRLYCSVQGVFLAIDQVEWFLEMGTPMEQMTVRRSFFQDFPEPENDIKVELVYSSDPNPSKRGRDPGVSDLCKIKWDTIPDFYSLPSWENEHGQVFRRLNYEISMTVVGTSLDFAIYYNNRRVASQNVAVEFAARIQPSIEAPCTPTKKPNAHNAMEVDGDPYLTPPASAAKTQTQMGDTQTDDDHPMPEWISREDSSDATWVPGDD